MEIRRVTDVQIFPYYAGVFADVPPVMVGEGMFSSGQMMNNQFLRLELTQAKASADIHVGATYSWTGKTTQGDQTNSHWMFCTGLDPHPTFGVIFDWSHPGRVAPLLSTVDDAPVKLEALSQVHAILKSPNPAYGHSQAKLGDQGWLVMMPAMFPVCIGVLIEDPTLPACFPEGSKDITLVAKSKRTLQTIMLDTLSCAKVGETALFLTPVEQK
ncbi:hypothetical protein [Tateyamaria sp.]|uniref:hypothetical protein n=1 Tax=Tateyamaria sp. TaxID=1929288 RepID=UPI003B21BE53